MTQKIATSAGAFILREVHGQLKIALAQRRHAGKVWVLPKGHVEPGESLEQAALREIHEEAGLVSVQLLAYLGSFVREVSPLGALISKPRKTVHYYLAYALPSNQPELPTEDGFAEPGWFSPAEVLELLPYEQEKAFMREHLGRLLV
ncbi:MAG TPA: NUDIX domain-containing protein [Ktedonobacteraceae bacterium]